MTDRFERLSHGLIAAGTALQQLNMVPATSGNFSARLDDKSIVITASGCHKGRLQTENIMLVDYDGHSLDERTPSAETLLHTQIYRQYPEAQAVLHGHGVYSTLMSQMDTDILYLRGYELLKILTGSNTHATEIAIPLFANDQDIARLAKQVDNYMNNNNSVHAYLIAGHGFYVWGESIDRALHRAEAFEFLMACEWKKGAVKNSWAH